MTTYIFERDDDPHPQGRIISYDEFLSMTADELREAIERSGDGWVARTGDGIPFIASSGWLFVEAESEAEAVAELRAGRSFPGIVRTGVRDQHT